VVATDRACPLASTAITRRAGQHRRAGHEGSADLRELARGRSTIVNALVLDAAGRRTGGAGVGGTTRTFQVEARS